MIKTAQSKEQWLEKLGLTKASKNVDKVRKLKRSTAIAYEHYRYVKPEQIRDFNADLKKRTIKNKGQYNQSYQTLAFTSLGNYNEIPPDQALHKLEEAQERKCFDSFEVAHIKKVEDPIIFGRIHDCEDRFYVAQWDEDVKIEDILKDGEG